MLRLRRQRKAAADAEQKPISDDRESFAFQLGSDREWQDDNYVHGGTIIDFLMSSHQLATAFAFVRHV